MFLDHKTWLQDITQAYIQGHDLQLDVYLKIANRLNLPQDKYWKLLKPF